MPKIYVAQTDTTAEGDNSKTLASGSMTTIKERLRAFPDTQWSINTVQIKTDVPTLCSLIENASAVIAPESTEKVRVSATGQVRGVK